MPAGCTAGEALARSGIFALHPALDAAACGVGIYGREVGGDHVLAAGDRVEVLRPLAEDPTRSPATPGAAGPLDERRAQLAVDDTGRGSGIGSSMRVTLSPSNQTTRCRRVTSRECPRLRLYT